MKRIIMLLSIFLLVFPFVETVAQNEETSIIINGNLSLPLGDYGESIGGKAEITRRTGFNFGDKVGLASIGYGIGVDLITPAFVDHLGWIISAKFILSPTNDEDVNNYFQNELDDTLSLSLETGTWFHIPVTTGFSYGINIAKDFNVYFSLQGGINITKQATRKATVNNVLVEETTFDTEIDFGYEGGVSFEILRRYYIGVKYLNLGNPRYEGNRYLDTEFFEDAYLENNPIFGDERNIQMLLITLGYRI